MPERAAWWPDGGPRGTLLVADLHLGKAETFRSHGIPVPGGVLAEQLGRLSRAIARTGAGRVVVLGDLLHARAGLTAAMLDEVRAWRRGHGVEIDLVPGNHDARAAEVADAWGVRVLGPAVEDGPFAYAHEPPRTAAADGRFTWCGHLHPAVTLRTTADSIKLPAFHLSASVGVLPAFTAFAGGVCVRPARDDRVFAVAEGRVIDVSRACGGSR